MVLSLYFTDSAQFSQCVLCIFLFYFSFAIAFSLAEYEEKKERERKKTHNSSNMTLGAFIYKTLDPKMHTYCIHTKLITVSTKPTNNKKSKTLTMNQKSKVRPIIQ